MAIYKCQDFGINDHFEVQDDNEDELIKIIVLHTQTSHGVKEISSEMMGKIKKAIIYDDTCGTSCQDYA